MNNVLEKLFGLYPFSQNKLERIVFGAKDVGIMLSNGNIGVCSTLCHTIDAHIGVLTNPNFSNYSHRVVVNAWVNANVNYTHSNLPVSDINEAVRFENFSKVCMVGYFGSLADKLAQKGVKIKVFDLDEYNKPVEPLKHQQQELMVADAVILTATSISNLTFSELIRIIPSRAKVFILGPSTPITQMLFSYPSIAGMFGAQFDAFDHSVLDAIDQGGGTRSFLKQMKKVYLKR
ncbi:MAG TPA: DUF364 domain-containing protein [Tenuifilaceae bacterium]|nr:DUF364 domain-containing protein [Tenuifilaceae bacterium]HPE17692.1 DUF364 domain-containing protein [Tenuifilaceae bacterium]HPJ45201.1 DUF364 domain-containing protein [Tenuifilaceae bacterium]HPQ33430.1 DUF364 domain-containing protein [Tenuifilaceae bacterium]HRX66930.1 DUF364 domain-containing protein [Tenuifilaceae bacterium]